MLLIRRPFVTRAMTGLQRAAFTTTITSAHTMPLILVDFDQTITIKDTIGLLGQFGVAQTHNPKPWSYFVDSYLEDYRAHRDQLPELPKDSNFEDFLQQLDSYKPVEKASLARVSKHKVFEGLSTHAFFEEGQKLREKVLQPVVISTLQQYKESVRIISLNWSKDWILGFLHELELRKDQIYSNDLTFVNDLCTGEIVPQILTTGDKQQLIESSIATNNEKVIYIGDSTGDIGALREY